MTLIVGMLASADGTSIRDEVFGSLHNGHLRAEQERSVYTTEAIEFRAHQPSHIGVDVDHHGNEIGEVIFMCQGQRGLLCVAEIDDDIAETLPDPFYLSAELEGRWSNGGHRDIELRGVAIVERSATVGKSKAEIVAGTIDDAHLLWANAAHRRLLERAREYHRDRRCQGDPRHRIDPIPFDQRDIQHLDGGLVLVDGEPIPVAGRSAGHGWAHDDGPRTRGPIEYGPPGVILSVR